MPYLNEETRIDTLEPKPADGELPELVIDTHAHFFNIDELPPQYGWYIAGQTARNKDLRGLASTRFSKAYRTPPPVDGVSYRGRLDLETSGFFSDALRLLAQMTNLRRDHVRSYAKVYAGVDLALEPLLDLEGWGARTREEGLLGPPQAEKEREDDLCDEVHLRLPDVQKSCQLWELTAEGHDQRYGELPKVVPYASFNPLRAVHYECSGNQACESYWESLTGGISEQGGEACHPTLRGDETRCETRYFSEWKKAMDAGHFAGVKLYPSAGYYPGEGCSTSALIFGDKNWGLRGAASWAPMRDRAAWTGIVGTQPQICPQLRERLEYAQGHSLRKDAASDALWQAALQTELDHVMREFWAFVAANDIPVVVHASLGGAELDRDYSLFGSAYAWDEFLSSPFVNSLGKPLRISFAHAGLGELSGYEWRRRKDIAARREKGTNCSPNPPLGPCPWEERHRCHAVDMVGMVERQRSPAYGGHLLYVDSSDVKNTETRVFGERIEELVEFEKLLNDREVPMLFGTDYFLSARDTEIGTLFAQQRAWAATMDGEARADFFGLSACEFLGVRTAKGQPTAFAKEWMLRWYGSERGGAYRTFLAQCQASASTK